MKNLILLLSLFLFNSLQAQQESLSLKAFDQLNVAGSINITLYEGSPKAEITMIQGDRDELEVIQKGNKLRIKFKNRINWSGKRKANINLYVQNLVSISVAAGAEVYSEFTLKANEFYVDVSSGAELSIALETKMLDADVNSGGSIEIEGAADELNVDANSGGSYNGKRMMVKDVDADVNSGGSIKVWVTEKLAADANSGGSVKYRGDPQTLDLDPGKWSGGSIKKI